MEPIMYWALVLVGVISVGVARLKTKDNENTPNSSRREHVSIWMKGLAVPIILILVTQVLILQRLPK